jgi:carboxypeptidase family protein
MARCCASRLFAVLLGAVLATHLAAAQTGTFNVIGTVVDPAGRPVADAHLEFDLASGVQLSAVTNNEGAFTIALPAPGSGTVLIQAPGFSSVRSKIDRDLETGPLTLHLERIAAANEQVVIAADVSDIAITSPDPSERVMVREELLDANPGRPGAPVSIPGMPIETAAGGIKAPQYFVPGVAGDHGEPIAQSIAVGSYLVPNNLSANAHGNGYADPNIYVSGALDSVGTDGGAYSVLEGNHALNMAATYNLRPTLQRSLTLTGDYRDADLTAGVAPSTPARKEWLALEANYGNGLMRTLEHRKQIKLNAARVFDAGAHEITLFAIGYWGVSHEGNLVPTGYALEVNDTLDKRQKDQTHTGLVAASDQWKLGQSNDISMSGFFRTYNLALFSNFGEGLIRQSEFRTVEGAEARETHRFKPFVEGMAGLLYNEDDIHNDDLDHYTEQFPAGEPYVYGPFLPVLGNNITIRELAPYVALHSDFGRHIRVYAGLRNDEIEMKNNDKFRPAYSFDEWRSFENPKATVTWSPGASKGQARWLPSASFSIGQAFFTQDPRITLAPSTTGTGASAFANPFERSHAEQLVLEKTAAQTDLRITLGRTTETATSGKIDPDNGTEFDLGPSTLKFLTASLRRPFSFGTVQAVFSKADARLEAYGSGANFTPAMVVPEAPRTIFDALTTLDRLPLALHARGEYEYVGHRLLDVGNSLHPSQYEAIPVGETRLAVVRSFAEGRLELAANAELARGYTGQTTENFTPSWRLGQVPYCASGSGPSGLPNDFDCANPSLGGVEQSVGIRMVSWVGGSISWRFNASK